MKICGKQESFITDLFIQMMYEPTLRKSEVNVTGKEKI